MHMPMTEINFMFLHSETVGKVKFPKTIKEAMKVLKVNGLVVRVPRTDNLAGDGADGGAAHADNGAVASTSGTNSQGTAKVSNGGKRKTMRVGVAVNAGKPRLVFVERKDVSTQTEDIKEDSEEEEDPVVAENISELRRKYMSDTIREEDFDEELERKQ